MNEKIRRGEHVKSLKKRAGMKSEASGI